MKNNFFRLICGVLVIATLTGCGNNNKDLDNDKKLKTKGKCTATECIKKISIDNTVEEINNIIGIDGKLTDEKYNIYYWELSDDSGIEVTYYSGVKGNIEVNIDRDLLVNSKVDFSRYSELQPKVKEGITYDEFITYLGNVKGTLIEKSSITNKYIWVAEDGSYLKGSFSNSSGKCTLTSGMIK